MITLRRVLIIISFLIAGWVSWGIYSYLFDRSLPLVRVNGLESGSCYAGDLRCLVSVDKTSDISVWLDKKPVISKFRSKAGAENILPIPTKAINNGHHKLKIEVCDTTYNANQAINEYDFEIDNTPLQAAMIRSGMDNKVFQGRTLHLQFQANKELGDASIKAFAGTFSCYPESDNSTIYECFIPIAHEEVPSEYPIRVDITDKVGNTHVLEDKFQVMAYPFKKQTVAVNNDKMENEREVGLPSSQLYDAMRECTQKSSRKKLWKGPFFVPLELARVTCDYGTVRTTQVKGRYAHKALDIIGPLNCVVWAPHDGVVVIKDRFVIEGNTVVIDHGLGVLSMLCHLDSFADISVGDRVRRGNPIGIMGKTGFATGAHLHWEQRVNDVPIDPMQWTKTDF
ncbi:hypothetical protein A3F06_02105 [candidate division TM6 bacterium RIFCSPHIGHO2_12_FULL_36_22]|nr:MAG: hypothetical protein A3F06_02105 [candidate division TM6 bacterium RIFCSPHIGHO2_12_FULL_36_22]